MLLALALALCPLQSLSNDSFDPQVLAEYTTESEYQSTQTRAIPIGDDTLISTFGRHPGVFTPFISDDLEWKLERLSPSGLPLWTTQLTIPSGSFLAQGWSLDDVAGTITFVTSDLGARLWSFDLATGALVGDEVIPLSPPLNIGTALFDPIAERLYLTETLSAFSSRVTAVSLASKTQSWTYSEFEVGALPPFTPQLHLSPDGSACYWVGETGENIFDLRPTFVKLDALSGAEIWTTLGPPASEVYSALSLDGQKLGFAYTFSGPAYGQIDTDSGQLDWQRILAETEYTADPRLAYSANSTRIAASFGRGAPDVGAIALGANATDGVADWVQTRDFLQAVSFPSAGSTRILPDDHGDWLWGYGSFEQGVLGFTTERLQGLSGVSLGSATTTVAGQLETYLGELSAPDSLGRVRATYLYNEDWVAFGWPFAGLTLVDPSTSQTEWSYLAQVTGKDRSFARQLAEVGGGAAALMLIEGEGLSEPGGELDDLLVCVDLDTGDELWARAVRAESFALSADGSQVAARGNDAALILLDALTGAELLQVQPSPEGDIWTEPLAAGAGYQPVLLGPDFLAYQESLPGGGELIVVDSGTGQVRFTAPVGTAAGSPLALSGDRLYFVFEEGDFRRIQWVSVTTGQVQASSDPIVGAESLVQHLLLRDGHLLAAVEGDLLRYDLDLVGSELVQSLTAPLALYPLAPGTGVLVNSAGKASQVDIPQPGAAPLDLGWELNVQDGSLLLTPADGGRVVVAPGRVLPGPLFYPTLELAPKFYDAGTGELLGESDPLFVGEYEFRAGAVSLAESNRLLLGTSLVELSQSSASPSSMTAGLIAADLPTLYQSSDQVLLSSPNAVDLYLRGPQASAGSGVHFLLAGLGQANPPTLVDGLEVPFTLSDPVTACTVLQCQPSIFEGFVGAWDANGLSEARLNTPPGLESLAGQTLDLAWLGFDSLAGPGLQLVSSTVSIELIP